MLFERLASRVLYADSSLRAPAEVLARNTLGQEGLWPQAISGDLPILLVRVVEEDDLPLVRQVLQAQEYWRLKGLRADVVLVNENPLGYLDAMQASLETLLDDGPWRSWRHRPGGAYLLRGERLSEAERVLLAQRRQRGAQRRPRRARASARPPPPGAARDAAGGSGRRGAAAAARPPRGRSPRRRCPS